MNVSIVLVVVIVMALILLFTGLAEISNKMHHDDDDHKSSTPFFDKKAQDRSRVNTTRSRKTIDKDNVSEKEKDQLFDDLDAEEEAFWEKYDFDPDDVVKKKKK